MGVCCSIREAFIPRFAFFALFIIFYHFCRRKNTSLLKFGFWRERWRPLTEARSFVDVAVDPKTSVQGKPHATGNPLLQGIVQICITFPSVNEFIITHRNCQTLFISILSFEARAKNMYYIKIQAFEMLFYEIRSYKSSSLLAFVLNHVWQQWDFIHF